jgi:DNA-directed RNA polymerase specialized sigma24 family protein
MRAREPIWVGWGLWECDDKRSARMSMFASLGTEFDDFVRDSSADLLRLALLLTGDRGQAEDLLQIALLRTASHWRAAGQNPRIYARRVLVNPPD